MMKKTILLVVMAAMIASCTTRPHYVLKANIAGSDSLTFILQMREAGKFITLDSAVSKKGQFKMEGTIEYPQMVLLTAKNTRNRTQFFIENAPMTISGKLDSLFDANISGSKTQEEYKSYVNDQKAIGNKYSSLYKEYQTAEQANDTAKKSAIDKQINALETQMTD